MVAKVLGTYEYRVRFWAGDRLSYSCDCPVGVNGEFCKHCVAVGLAWLKGEAEHETFEEGQGQQFEEYLDEIRTKHKRKRNLMKLLKSM